MFKLRRPVEVETVLENATKTKHLFTLKQGSAAFFLSLHFSLLITCLIALN